MTSYFPFFSYFTAALDEEKKAREQAKTREEKYSHLDKHVESLKRQRKSEWRWRVERKHRRKK